MANQIKSVLILAVLIAVWPLCAAVWLLQWPFVRFMVRAPHAGVHRLTPAGRSH
jgi:hypothetical protein